jgi:hypothetical protein
MKNTEKRVPGTIGDKEANKLEKDLYTVMNLTEALKLIARAEDTDDDMAMALFGIADAIDAKAKEAFEFIEEIAFEIRKEKEKQRPAA